MPAVANVLVGYASRLDSPTITTNLPELSPDTDYVEKRVGMAEGALDTDLSASSSSVVQLRAGLGARTSVVANHGVRFSF